MIRRSGLGACAVLLAFAAIAATPGDEPPPFSPPGSFLDPGHFAHRDGATIYRAVCQGCHMPDARGAVGAGAYPALAANVRLAAADYPVMMVLHGRRAMPAFGVNLDDAQIAEVANYVRTHFDNHYADAITPQRVAELRATGAKP